MPVFHFGVQVVFREYSKDYVNLQIDVRYNYLVWRFILWLGKKILLKRQLSSNDEQLSKRE